MKKDIVIAVFIFLLANSVFAQSPEDNIFLTDSDTEFIEIGRSKYFNIYSQKKVALNTLNQQLNIRSEYLLLNPPNSENKEEYLKNRLGEIIDAIFLETSDILRMYLYDFQGNIKICKGKGELKQSFFTVFNKDDLEGNSFYLHNTNSIYINISNLSPDILGYEIAHAIISHYFAVLPPSHVQEILAKDVESQLKKLAK